jgi:hypothetical protein
MFFIGPGFVCKTVRLIRHSLTLLGLWIDIVDVTTAGFRSLANGLWVDSFPALRRVEVVFFAWALEKKEFFSKFALYCIQ